MPDPAAPPPVRVTLPPAVARLLGALLVALVFFCIGLGYIFVDQLRSIRDQDRKQTALVANTLPLLRETRPLLDQTRRRLPRTKESLTRTLRLLRTTQPLVDDLVRADLPSTVTMVRSVTGVLADRGRLAATLDAAVELIARIRDTDLVNRSSATLAATGRLLRDVGRTDLVHRTSEVLTRSDRLLEKLERTSAVDRLLHSQRSFLRLQRRLIRLQVTLLGVQNEALVHIRSLDAKTGGTAPAPASTPGAP
jgi:hypothetical protein